MSKEIERLQMLTRSLILMFILFSVNCCCSYQEEYDFIIVGAGAAGCMLANRLSEDPNSTVLLIEAGGRENFIEDIPILAALPQLTPVNWGYETEKSSTACLGLVGEKCKWPRGKVLGGTTTINYMAYTRGNKMDYNKWANLGYTGWSYDEVLPYFLKFENMLIPELANDTKYHSTKGELAISQASFHTKASLALLEAAKEKGAKVLDYNGEEQGGYSLIQSTLKDGVRWSANKAFLEPVRNRKNLKVLLRSQVTKILIHPENKTAYGVEYKRWSLLNMKACARKEVILSAGVFGSAQLLMLAGIGPKDHLEDVKIPVLQDSKVGYNLKDHYSFGNLFFIANDSITIRLDNYIKDAFHVLEYLFTRKGLLTVTGGFESLGFEDVTGDGIPDIEVAFGGATMGALKPVIWAWGAKPETFNTVYKNFAHMEIFTIFPLLMHPKSSGRLMLKDKNPLHKPLLFHNYFTHPDDMATLIKGVRRSIELVDTHAFRKYGSKLFNKSLPACQKHEFNSDEYWECSARHLTFSIYHQCGTCKMGPDSDPDAVVDPSLRVRGINNLRVIDASIIPTTVTGHIQAAVYMIAEKGASMIKSFWKNK